jgi:hypothetical protein
VAHLLGVERVKLIAHLEQTATEGAGVRIAPRILLAAAAHFDALEIG